MSARLQPGRDAVPAVAEQPRRSPRHVVSAPCRRAPGREAGRPMLCAGAPAHGRSEEHTSELQSLMRISYAVFCLKKKITPNTTTPNDTQQPNKHSKHHIYSK